MTTDDLSAPLGQGPARKRRFRPRLPVTPPQAIAIGLGLFLVTFAGFALFNDNPLGGEPLVRLTYDPAALPGDKPARAPAAEPPKREAAAKGTDKGTDKGGEKTADKAVEPGAGQKTITIIDGSSGTRRDVVVATTDAGAGDADGVVTTVAAGINPRLLEKSRHGMIPVIADGLKPFRAYAGGTDADRAKAAKMPSIAIVVTGLGVGAAKTADAIVKLPAAVTLAFTPYGADPAKLAERARTQKHELLLQVPMEPFDYPDNDPGPQTLLASLPQDQNLDRLYWHLSRIQGYVGLANFMGARFVATDAAMQPLLKEAAKRGLSYLDDGTSPRSVASQAAETASLPYARADASIDAVPSAAEIDRALGKLETIARERGVAIGIASALPISVERINAWARTLEGRGILLVPLTTAMLKSKSS
ncbi:divergent polysaccharide deacetylase family protein [Bradyrhizobium sp. U87765 SZCCT0131]|uniref:divergent polysaccharide deacetylase family protein n=1 Tax=unclassified Bradyrhizobium TaxID=2631580 RepID=UPI001BA5B289|nr:divergent polysaccharide deacetylase family protein [Bradyrhizobium sp. U87765 SZCCT0131]MBR1259197.1 divergent polysaccharide deacetylase family protein [Bradyrhizobium sp. U87765 SZCCT0134]MBR1305338.1 divergent polysaccharide deacetylase family protein [Bradyrhizobium sp. U87765 SZCCT0110]MBR1321124.1 divergent polysaccharide deacetylase family protein [Bradyrhizobium sp. U87765 SZCCT0109]MBR1350222.1 divergent polysaccharide deacetylase family protein [Bradyrhizobium sp. U87765 SZCCT0048